SKATDRRSVSGRVIICGGPSVCWFSRSYPFDFRSGVCRSRGRGKGVIVFETGLAFYVTQ
ncbi:unnamed protein product, partial [Ascophyllum nodosum]